MRRFSFAALAGWFLLSAAGAFAADTSDSYNFPQFDVPSRMYSRGLEDNGGSGGKHQPIAVGQVFSTQLDGRCVDIHNNSSKTIYFPTTSPAEAAAFLNNVSANVPGVTVGPCTYRNNGWSEWSSCTASCGGGTRGRVLDCRKSIGEVIVGDECAANCNGGSTCVPEEACNTQDCVQVEVPPGPPPPGQDEVPTAFCFFFVSGGLVNNYDNTYTYAEIGKTNFASDFVGPGSYARSETVFKKADDTTFDGIAVGKDTHITIYSGYNFSGGIILDAQGPLVMNNVIWRNSYSGSDYVTDDWLTNVWPGSFHEQFPPSSRRWSDTNMHPWGHGTSIKVTCNE